MDSPEIVGCQIFLYPHHVKRAGWQLLESGWPAGRTHSERSWVRHWFLCIGTIMFSARPLKNILRTHREEPERSFEEGTEADDKMYKYWPQEWTEKSIEPGGERHVVAGGLK